MGKYDGVTGSVIAGAFAIAIAMTFFYAWIFMLLVGVLHNEVAEGIPALGYWTSLVVLIVLRLIVAMVTPSKGSSNG